VASLLILAYGVVQQVEVELKLLLLHHRHLGLLRHLYMQIILHIRKIGGRRAREQQRWLDGWYRSARGLGCLVEEEGCVIG
jgi:hypothetical protein